jgi:hypothetical protein
MGLRVQVSQWRVYSAGRDTAAKVTSEPTRGTKLDITATDQMRPIAATTAIPSVNARILHPLHVALSLPIGGLAYFLPPRCEVVHRCAKFFDTPTMLRVLPRLAGFIEPCLPSPAPNPPAGDNWIHEVKLDGFRMMVRRDTASVRLLTRNGYDWTARFPLIAEAAERLRARSFLIDGEAVACDGDGLPVFDQLRYRWQDGRVFCRPDSQNSAGKVQSRHTNVGVGAQHARFCIPSAWSYYLLCPKAFCLSPAIDGNSPMRCRHLGPTGSSGNTNFYLGTAPPTHPGPR